MAAAAAAAEAEALRRELDALRAKLADTEASQQVSEFRRRHSFSQVVSTTQLRASGRAVYTSPRPLGLRHVSGRTSLAGSAHWF